MTLLSRHCDGCNEERLFEQFHAEPASCPDVPDGDSLIIGLPLRQYSGRDRTTRAA